MSQPVIRFLLRACAVVAVLVGSGGLLRASAAPVSEGSVFVPIAPVRVLDTRVGAGLPSALVSDLPAVLQLTGTVATVGAGDVVSTGTPVPVGATGVVTNTTVVGPSTIGYLAVRPGSAVGEPATSSINFTTPGAIVPNAVTVELPTSGLGVGAVQLWFHGTNPTATTDVLVDVVGYYIPAPTGTSPGPRGAAGAVGPTGAAGAQGPAGRISTTGPNVVHGLLPAGATVINAAIDSNDLPVVVYRDGGILGDRIKMLTCVDPTCANPPALTTVVTFPAGYPEGVSATVGTDDVVRVAYVSLNQLTVVTCLNPACTGTPHSNVAAILAAPPWIMSSPSIAALPNGLAVISVAVNGDVFDTAPAPFGRITVVNCGNFSCSGGTSVTAVHNLSDVGTRNGPLIIAPDGHPWLTFIRDSDAFYSIFIDCKDVSCSQRDATPIAEAFGMRGPRMSIGFDGTPLLSFWSTASSIGEGNALWFHGPRLQGGWASGSVVSHSTTVDGRPIMFYDTAGSVYSATCGDFDCSVFDPPVRVTTTGALWPFRGPNGYPLLIHADTAGVRLIQCGNPTCTAS